MIRIVVALVQGVLLPVFDIDVLNAAHQQFQFVFVEDFQKRQRTNRSESLQKRCHLLFDTRNESPLNNQSKRIISN